jgi:2-polyprenyl-3-methyl-5-hydroxy-6-metoxy-1,4-benzoquinol methylase
MEQRTREPQYQSSLDIREQQGLTTLGLMTNQAWYDDPKRLAFTFSRYKFVAKMLTGRRSVLEVGCADAFGTRIVRQFVDHVVAIDFDPVFVADVQSRTEPRWPIECFQHDMLSGPISRRFDAAFSLDVLEHISPDHERVFLKNIVDSLQPHGVLLIGTPSLESQAHASAISQAGHVNCKTSSQLADLCGEYFHNVFMFSMNDEVVHTGYAALAHYLIALCADRRDISTDRTGNG